ncbi:putative glutathione S-transferase-like protein [Devosia sp. LC5]|uniref:glutathione binding-like protein n=1 Tax=Devosia sp. LC5 TaxID=1502724 RepID=UPI0004E39255|nr:glutathione binding-like protein [Devosia sp. LC5]KFC70000.1 putative glutathione S-transferase-like protein [Devosia sp. LC5]
MDPHGRAWINLFWLLVRTPKPQHDAAAIATAHARTLAALRILEANLAGHPYVAGEELSYADIVAGVSLYRWFTMDIERPAMPNVEAWYGLLQRRRAFVDVVMVDYAELVGRLAF